MGRGVSVGVAVGGGVGVAVEGGSVGVAVGGGDVGVAVGRGAIVIVGVAVGTGVSVAVGTAMAWMVGVAVSSIVTAAGGWRAGGTQAARSATQRPIATNPLLLFITALINPAFLGLFISQMSYRRGY